MTCALTAPLIGRVSDLELLCRLVSGVTRGSAAKVLIEGEAGIGKTRLLTSVIDEARAQGMTVLRGAADPLEMTRPFGAIAEALGLRSGSKDPRRSAIGRLLVGEEVGSAGPPAAGQLQFRAVEEIVDLVETLTDRAPLLVALDDLHWADGATLLTFSWMTRRLTQVPLLLVGTLRPSPRSPELNQLLDDARQGGVTLMSLKALGNHDVEALVQAELGLPPGPALAEAVGPWAYDAAGAGPGNGR